MSAEAVAQKFGQARPGYELVSYGEVGLPFYRIAITAHVLEHKPIAPFAEFALRAVDAGIDEPVAIGELLGLEAPVVEATLAGSWKLMTSACGRRRWQRRRGSHPKGPDRTRVGDGDRPGGSRDRDRLRRTAPETRSLYRELARADRSEEARRP